MVAGGYPANIGQNLATPWMVCQYICRDVFTPEGNVESAYESCFSTVGWSHRENPRM